MMTCSLGALFLVSECFTVFGDFFFSKLGKSEASRVSCVLERKGREEGWTGLPGEEGAEADKPKQLTIPPAHQRPFRCDSVQPHSYDLKTSGP